MPLPRPALLPRRWLAPLLALLPGTGCTPASEPATPLAPAPAPAPAAADPSADTDASPLSCADTPHLVELYTFDRRVLTGRHPGCTGLLDYHEFETYCIEGGHPPDCSAAHYGIQRDEHDLPGCRIDASDHTHTLHIAQHLCRGDRAPCADQDSTGTANCNRYLAADSGRCLSGGCYYLDCFMDPLKIMGDVGRQASSGNDTRMQLGDQASFLAWVRMDLERRNFEYAGRGTQSILFTSDFTVGLRVDSERSEGPTMSLTFSLHDTGRVEGERHPVADDWTLVATTFARAGDRLTVEMFIDGEAVSAQPSSLELKPGSPHLEGFAPEFLSMGGNYCGYLDDVMVFDRALSQAEIRAIQARYRR
jgi:hypothetical protein